jgi:hypothetical protein
MIKQVTLSDRAFYLKQLQTNTNYKSKYVYKELRNRFG